MTYCAHCSKPREDETEPCECGARTTCKDPQNLTKEEEQLNFDEWLAASDDSMSQLCYSEEEA